MTRIEDMLRDALAETPATTPAADPLAGLDRRIHRARRRLAVGAGVAAAAIAAAVVVPLTTLNGGAARGAQIANTPTPTPTNLPVLVNAATWIHGSAVDVATGPAGTWALVQGATATHETYQVVELDDATGAVLKRVDVPGPVDFVAVDLGHVWAFGGGDGGYGNLSVVDVIDPQTGDVATHQYHGAGGPQGMAFSTDSAWITLDVANRVDRLDISGPKLGLQVTESVPVPHPTQIVTETDGSMWVRGDHGLVQLVPQNGKGVSSKPATNVGHWPLFADAGNGAIWTSDDPSRIISFTPATTSNAPVSAAYGARLPVPGRPQLVSPDGQGGVYVATADRHSVDTASAEATISYFDRQAVQREVGPTAVLRNVLVTWLVADPSGGVLYVNDQGNLIHWQPAAR